VLDAVRAALESIRAPGPTSFGSITIALSGGRDSIALLDALAVLAPEFGVTLTAIHVHHGLSPNADAWAALCADACEKRGVALTIRRVVVERRGGESLEAAAARTLWDCEAMPAVALAHHADDQAETVLLQLLRGAGHRALGDAGCASRHPVQLVRPFYRYRGGDRGLSRPPPRLNRRRINVDTGRKRNLRRQSRRVSWLRSAIDNARPLAGAGRAAQLADALAHWTTSSLRRDAAGSVLDRAMLTALAGSAPARAKNVLRWFLRLHGLASPSSALLAAMLEQLAHAAPDARVRLAHAGVEFGIHRGRILAHRPALAPYAIPWRGESSIALPHGTLEFAASAGAGISQAAIANAAVTIRKRGGGERIRLKRGGPSRTLKHLLHDAGLAPWQRDAYPLVFCGDALVAVPGIGVDVAFQATAGVPGYEVWWRPAAP
jgi:tRNA(Ile)-lysidine synthase